MSWPGHDVLTQTSWPGQWVQLVSVSEMGRPGQDFASCLRRPGQDICVLLYFCPFVHFPQQATHSQVGQSRFSFMNQTVVKGERGCQKAKKMSSLSGPTCGLQMRWVVGDPTSLECDNMMFAILGEVPCQDYSTQPRLQQGIMR